MSMAFSHDGHVYQNCQPYNHVDADDGEVKLIIVQIDGLPKLWQIDAAQGFSEIQRYYRNTGLNQCAHMYSYELKTEVVLKP